MIRAFLSRLRTDIYKFPFRPRVMVRPALILMTILSSLAVLYSGLWFFLAHQIWQEMLQWQETIHWQQAKLGGFPGAIVLDWRGIHTMTANGMIWDAEQVTGTLSPFAPRTIHFQAHGKQIFRFPDQAPQSLKTDKAALDLIFTAQPQLVLLLEGIRLNDEPIAEQIHLSVKMLSRQNSDPAIPAYRIPTWSFVLYSYGWHITNPPSGMDSTLTSLAVSGQVQGSLDRGAAAWSNDGGTVEVERFRLQWSPLRIEGGGTVALTEQGGLMLAMTTETSGVPDLIDTLVQEKYLESRTAQVTKVGLSLLMRPNAAGQPVLVAPITIQNDQLSFGPLPTLPLPKWRLWGHNP